VAKFFDGFAKICRARRMRFANLAPFWTRMSKTTPYPKLHRPDRTSPPASSRIILNRRRSWQFQCRSFIFLSPFWRISRQNFFFLLPAPGGFLHINLFDCRHSGDQGTSQIHLFSPVRGRIYFFMANLAIYRHYFEHCYLPVYSVGMHVSINGQE
jgi:hypothetical protein